jgi:hypothetical protein
LRNATTRPAGRAARERVVDARAGKMRLLNVHTKCLKDFPDETPAYAILSHTWGENEITFQDLIANGGSVPNDSTKINGCCDEAAKNTLEWVWIDTCCIDKSSSAELSEAINSMYRWYEEADCCYVYLEDFDDSLSLESLSVAKVEEPPVEAPPAGEPPAEESLAIVEESQTSSLSDDASKSEMEDAPPDLQGRYLSALEKCRWFTRGWTLQELIASRRIKLYDRSWNLIGLAKLGSPGPEKNDESGNPDSRAGVDLNTLLGKRTGVSSYLLKRPPDLRDISAAVKMAWAAGRQVTKAEDQAYSMMGLFGVNMALLYGEGRRKAFQRLVREISSVVNDQTIFAWRATDRTPEGHGMLARLPSDYWKYTYMYYCPNVIPYTPPGWKETHFSKTNLGLRLRMRLCRLSSCPSTYLGMLHCTTCEARDKKLILAVPLELLPRYDADQGTGIYTRFCWSSPVLVPLSSFESSSGLEDSPQIYIGDNPRLLGKNSGLSVRFDAPGFDFKIEEVYPPQWGSIFGLQELLPVGILSPGMGPLRSDISADTYTRHQDIYAHCSDYGFGSFILRLKYEFEEVRRHGRHLPVRLEYHVSPFEASFTTDGTFDSHAALTKRPSLAALMLELGERLAISLDWKDGGSDVVEDAEIRFDCTEGFFDELPADPAKRDRWLALTLKIT